MSYHGDISLGDTIDIKFSTRQASGAPTTLAGSPAVAAYVDNGIIEISGTPITLTVDFDGRTGLNNVRVVATSGNGFAANTNVTLVLTAGTVNSVSVVGEVVGSFSIEKRSAVRPTTSGRTLTIDASGRVQVTDAQLLRVLDRVDYQRGHHTVAGATFYVDGVGGNDTTGDGSRAAPYKTISKALTVCTSNVHDEIILLPNSSGGPTTITETAAITVNKNYVQIRGPGRDSVVTRSNNGDVFSITANGVGLSGFRVATFGGSTSNAISVSGGADFVQLHRLWIESAHQDAVSLNVANRCEVLDCTIVAAGRDGIRVSSGAGTGTYNLVLNSVIRDCVGSAVNLQGSDASECRIQRNVIRDNAVGITIASGVIDTVITDNRMINNTTQISDSGTNTLQQWNFLSTGTDGLASDTSGTTTLLSRLSAARAGYLDNLSAGAVALQSSFPSNFALLGINGSGHLSRVTLTDTVTTYTGNTPQTGDAFARIGANGAGLTSIGDSRLANLDAAVSTRLASASYTAPDNAGITAIKTTTDKLDTALELDGAVYRYTVNALENAPSGGGGGGTDWTIGEKEQIRSALGLDGTKTAATGGQLQDIKAKTDNLPATPASQADATADSSGVTTLLSRLSATRAGYIDNLSGGAAALQSSFPANFASLTLTNGQTVGTSTLDASGVRSAVGLATNNLDAQLGAVPSAAVNATAVRNELAVELARVDMALSALPTAQEIEDEVLDSLASAHNTANTIGAKINASGSATDPWALTEAELDAYGPGTAAAALNRLLAVPPPAPVIVVPDPSTDDSGCVVYMACAKSTGVPFKGALIRFELSDDPSVSDGKVQGSPPVIGVAGADGMMTLTLARTDTMLPVGRTWVMQSEDLGIPPTPFTLEDAGPVDLSVLL